VGALAIVRRVRHAAGVMPMTGACTESYAAKNAAREGAGYYDIVGDDVRKDEGRSDDCGREARSVAVRWHGKEIQYTMRVWAARTTRRETEMRVE